MIQLNFWPTFAFAVMILSWLAFVFTFSIHKRPPAPPDQKRDHSSITGIVLQGLAYALVWIVPRPWFTPMLPYGKGLEIGLSILTVLVAIGSVWFCTVAIRTLGTQWSLAARILEGHKLVTEGPYSVVRNPIYTGMFGMLLATGLAVSQLVGLVIAVGLFAIGTFIRVRSEERLLQEMFGPEFDAYARNVSAVIPYLI